MIACILEKKDTDIQNASESIRYLFTDYFPWEPVVDNNFLHDTPRNLRSKGKFRKVELMISFTSHEGGTILGSMVNSFGVSESVDNGVTPSVFKTFIRKLAHARNNE